METQWHPLEGKANLHKANLTDNDAENIASKSGASHLTLNFIDYLCASRGIERGAATQILGDYVLKLFQARASIPPDYHHPIHNNCTKSSRANNKRKQACLFTNQP